MAVSTSGIPLGAYMTFWYRILEKWFPGTAVKSVGSKAISDLFMTIPEDWLQLFCKSSYMYKVTVEIRPVQSTAF